MGIRSRQDWWCVQSLLPPVKADPLNPTLPNFSPPDMLEAALLRMSQEDFAAFYTTNDLIAEKPVTTGNALIDKLEAEFWSEARDG